MIKYNFVDEDEWNIAVHAEAEENPCAIVNFCSEIIMSLELLYFCRLKVSAAKLIEDFVIFFGYFARVETAVFKDGKLYVHGNYPRSNYPCPNYGCSNYL